MTSQRLVHVIAVAICLLGSVFWPKAAFAFPDGVPTGVFVIGGDPASAPGRLTVNGCNQANCHGFDPGGIAVGPAPSSITLSVNGGAFQAFGGGTITVPHSGMSKFTIHAHVNQTAASPCQWGVGNCPAAGFAVYHNDASSGDANGLLGVSPGDDPLAQACSGTSCGGTATSGNTEVTHTSPHPGPNISLTFTYTPPTSCGTVGTAFPFRLWINGVNGDNACQRPDRAAEIDFNIMPSCDDGDMCTTDGCTGTACTHSATNPCNDGNACTTDTCSGNACTFTPINCNDGDPCTVDSCSGGVCQHPQMNCDDANACTTDSCSGGVCSHVSTCQAGDQCNNASVCIPASGCQPRVPKTGAACNADSNACTNPDTCSAGGVCQAGPAVTCTPIDQCHSVGGCVPASGCPAQVPLTGNNCGNAPSCVGNVLHPNDLCNNGTCTVQATVNCNGQCLSSPAPAHCTGSCTSDTDCLAGSYCNHTGNCVPQVTQGNACNLTLDCLTVGTCRECSTGNCVDGVCCNSACAGGTNDCLACNNVGSMGVCSNRPMGSACNDGTLCTTVDTCNNAGTCVGSSPVVCTAQDSCHVAGVCNGATGTCSNPAKAAGSVCAPPVCADAFNITAQSTCTNAATCQPGATTSCAPNKCAAGACSTGCSTDGDCAPTAYCDTSVVGGQCKTKQAVGATCKPGADDSCQSGHCVDGFCCDLACTGQCEACDIGGKQGTCSPTTGAPHGGRAACTTDGTACGGACDGNDADRATCIYPTANCRGASCTNGTATAAANCSGGSCPAVVTQDCKPYVCGATQCNGNCTVDTDCTMGNWCKLGVCTPLLKKGDLCTGNNQCETTQCVDHYCCDSLCNGQCQACDNNGSAGTCSTVMSGPPHGGRFGCAGISMCQGSCNGTSATVCGFPGANVQCTAPSCNAGTATSEADCNGAGSCTTTDTNPCKPYACGETKCRTACASTSDCAKGFQCIGVNCVPIDFDAGTPSEDGGEIDASDANATPDVSVSDGGPAADVSQGPGTDGGAPNVDAGGENTIDVPAIPNAQYDGGCSCRVSSGTASQHLWSLFGLAAAVTVAGRRRSRRRPGETR